MAILRGMGGRGVAIVKANRTSLHYVAYDSGRVAPIRALRSPRNATMRRGLRTLGRERVHYRPDNGEDAC